MRAERSSFRLQAEVGREGVPDPEAFNAAIIGAFDPIYGRSGCARHAEVGRMLLNANPRLRPGSDARAHIVRGATRIRGCDEVTRLIQD